MIKSDCFAIISDIITSSYFLVFLIITQGNVKMNILIKSFIFVIFSFLFLLTSCESRFVETAPSFDLSRKKLMEERIQKKENEDRFIKAVLNVIKNFYYIGNSIYANLTNKPLTFKSNNTEIEKLTLKPQENPSEDKLSSLAQLFSIYVDKIPVIMTGNDIPDLENKYVRKAQIKTKNSNCTNLESILYFDAEKYELIVYFRYCKIIPKFKPSIKVGFVNTNNDLKSTLPPDFNFDSFKIEFLNSVALDFQTITADNLNSEKEPLSCEINLEKETKSIEQFFCNNTEIKIKIENKELEIKNIKFQANNEDTIISRVVLKSSELIEGKEYLLKVKVNGDIEVGELQ